MTEHHEADPVDGDHEAPSLAPSSIQGTGRRSVLLGVGALAGAGALTACSSPATPTDTSGGGGGGAAGATSIPTSEVPVGGAKFLPDARTVVTQPKAGTFKAFDTTCPHQGCAVSSVQGDQLVCPCHQSHFALATGDVESGPAPTGLTPKTVTVSGSNLSVG
ncbi:Rieske (2Fe-2S) protein [Intrasporangium sp. YIM S08009]|uniref:Rieske (2Fe-2S) protein n=1 Tax=Intrasporangium zincisolvens TaxID=3080018 RepID=UPI002B062369|nr:Rieske (2Fe-2S) protein [Intrasporangium sp. YIM S08009]